MGAWSQNEENQYEDETLYITARRSNFLHAGGTFLRMELSSHNSERIGPEEW
jgi:hypothetical protein